MAGELGFGCTLVNLERIFPCSVMSLMRLNFLATYLRNLGLRDTTHAVLEYE